MARKEVRSNRWTKSERVGEVTLFISPRSPYWQMYWEIEIPTTGGNALRSRKRRKAHRQSTRETDLSLARLVAGRKSEELFKRRHYPDQERKPQRTRMGPIIDDFVFYVETLGRCTEYLSKLKGRLHCLRVWMEKQRLLFVQDVSPTMLRKFQEHLRKDRGVTASTANHYLDAVHNFFGYVIFKRKLMSAPNPAATGRQAELEKHDEKEELGRIRTNLHTGRPLGSDAWLAKLETKLNRQVRPLPVGRPKKNKTQPEQGAKEQKSKGAKEQGNER
ncbi:MAG: hypothetical protein KAV82_03540 [Phycisphaerae bacterium]|nr:hypothetical protein [Phycisphaerae bacterium]